MLWIFFLIAIFIMHQKNAFGQKKSNFMHGFKSANLGKLKNCQKLALPCQWVLPIWFRCICFNLPQFYFVTSFCLDTMCCSEDIPFVYQGATTSIKSFNFLRWEISVFSLLSFCQMRDSSVFSVCILFEENVFIFQFFNSQLFQTKHNCEFHHSKIEK